MKKLIIETTKCPQNHLCPSVRICPKQALTQEGMKAPIIDYDKCIACGICAKSCGKQALQIVEG